MKKAKPFGYSVSYAGLPRNWCTVDATGRENVRNLTAQEVAKMYWLLEGIYFEYAYVVNGRRIERKMSLEAHVEPRDRIAIEPSFYYNEVDKEGIERLLELELFAIAEEEGKFHVRFRVEEQDEDSMFGLCSENIENRRLLDTRVFEFMDREIEIGLWTAHEKWGGRIEYFRVRTEYYVVGES